MRGLRILFQDESLVVVDKPAGFYVHPPEDPRFSISSEVNCLALLRDQLGQWVYPVHRLDRATSGVLVFGLSPESAARLSAQFVDRSVEKTYVAVVRGWPTPPAAGCREWVMDTPVDGKPALSRARVLAHVELPVAIPPHLSSRYALVQVQPETGRLHQIRRHLARLSYPLVGDTVYGDGKHNRAFRQRMGTALLYLKAAQLSLRHPESGQKMTFQSRWTHAWHQVFDLFGVCPIFRGSEPGNHSFIR
jgi:tRNA pseudouridine65 synthase